MQTDEVTITLSPRLLREVDRLVSEGWYIDRDEVLRDAVRELVERKRLGRLEAAVGEDIMWGLGREQPESE